MSTETTQRDSRSLVFNNPGDFSRYLDTAKGVIAKALPKHLNPDRMLRLAVTAFSTTPKLRLCTGESILASIVIASQLGLEPGVAGQAYLIPYGNKCTLVPGWQGLVGLLNNSGRATAWSGAVFDGDEFEFQLGSEPRIIHRPGANHGDPDKMTHVYACGKVNGSELPVIECWKMERVWRHRDKMNKVGRDHYSFKHPEMYARKVVLLQVLKYMPRSIELNDALAVANAHEASRSVNVQDGSIVIEPQSTDIEVAEPVMQQPAGQAKMRPRVENRRTVAPPDDLPFTGESEATSTREKVKPVVALRNLIKGSRRTEPAVLEYLEAQGHPKKSTLDFVDEKIVQGLVDGWADLYQDIHEEPSEA